MPPKFSSICLLIFVLIGLIQGSILPTGQDVVDTPILNLPQIVSEAQLADLSELLSTIDALPGLLPNPPPPVATVPEFPINMSPEQIFKVGYMLGKRSCQKESEVNAVPPGLYRPPNIPNLIPPNFGNEVSDIFRPIQNFRPLPLPISFRGFPAYPSWTRPSLYNPQDTFNPDGVVQFQDLEEEGLIITDLFGLPVSYYPDDPDLVDEPLRQPLSVRFGPAAYFTAQAQD